jgi:hypothetical protein
MTGMLSQKRIGGPWKKIWLPGNLFIHVRHHKLKVDATKKGMPLWHQRLEGRLRLRETRARLIRDAGQIQSFDGMLQRAGK